MIEQLRRECYDAMLPGALCTQQMRNELDAAVERLGVTHAAVMRAAVEIFLKEHLKQIEEELQKERPAKKSRGRKTKEKTS